MIFLDKKNALSEIFKKTCQLSRVLIIILLYQTFNIYVPIGTKLKLNITFTELSLIVNT